MTNTTSAQKQMRQNRKKYLKNITRKSAIKTAIKKVQSAVTAQEPLENVKELMNAAQAKLARAARKGVLHKNTVRRRISNLASMVNQAYASVR